MSFNPDVADTTTSRLDALRSKWGWFIALGVLLLIAGGVAFANLLAATVASVYVVGFLMLIGGGFQIGQAFGIRDWGGFALWLAGGLLYAIAGVATFANPLLASAVLTLLLAATLLASGVVRGYIGFTNRHRPGSGWIIAGGIVTALLGVIIAIGWPVNSLWVLGMFLAVDLIFQGWTCIAFGIALRQS